MNLKDIFKEYKSPVDEAGWESIAKDPEVVKYNRRHLARRIVGYSAAALTTVAVVATLAVLLVTKESVEPHTPVARNSSANVESSTVEATPSAAPTSGTATSAIAAQTEKSSAIVNAEPTTAAASGNNVAGNTTATAVPAVSNIATKTKTAQATPAPLTTIPAKVSTPAKPSAPTMQVSPKAENQNISGSDTKSPEPEEPESHEDEGNLYIPNAFSPNGDGLNDLFFVKADFDPEIFEMAIYTRKGELVFLTKDINIGWDGMRYGTALPFGVYTYFIKYIDQNGKPQNRRGQITLLK